MEKDAALFHFPAGRFPAPPALPVVRPARLCASRLFPQPRANLPAHLKNMKKLDFRFSLRWVCTKFAPD